jgi:hypothetical protein
VGLSNELRAKVSERQQDNYLLCGKRKVIS